MNSKRASISAAAVLIIFLLTACTNMATPTAIVQTVDAESSATALPEATAIEVMPTEVVATEAVAIEVAVPEDPTPEPMVESTDWTETATVDGDYYVLGNPGAPIRLVDYSDFM